MHLIKWSGIIFFKINFCRFQRDFKVTCVGNCVSVVDRRFVTVGSWRLVTLTGMKNASLAAVAMLPSPTPATSGMPNYTAKLTTTEFSVSNAPGVGSGYFRKNSSCVPPWVSSLFPFFNFLCHFYVFLITRFCDAWVTNTKRRGMWGTLRRC